MDIVHIKPSRTPRMLVFQWQYEPDSISECHGTHLIYASHSTDLLANGQNTRLKISISSAQLFTTSRIFGRVPVCGCGYIHNTMFDRLLSALCSKYQIEMALNIRARSRAVHATSDRISYCNGYSAYIPPSFCRGI